MKVASEKVFGIEVHAIIRYIYTVSSIDACPKIVNWTRDKSQPRYLLANSYICDIIKQNPIKEPAGPG
jgi:hypothetical protein